MFIASTGQPVLLHAYTEDGRSFLILGDDGHELDHRSNLGVFELVNSTYELRKARYLRHNDPQGDPLLQYAGVNIESLGLLACSINVEGQPWFFNGRKVIKYDVDVPVRLPIAINEGTPELVVYVDLIPEPAREPALV